MASIVDMLRKKNEEDATLSSLKNKAEFWQGQQQNVQPATVQTPGNYGGVPAPTPVNYGGILQNAVNTFMGARSAKKYEEAKANNEAVSKAYAIETLQGDPQALKLYQAAQYGVPGADKALAKYLEPKKPDAIAGLLQTLEKLDGNNPAVVRQIAQRYGMKEDEAKGMILGAQQKAAEKINEEQGFELKKLGMQQGAADARAAANRDATLEAARIRASSKNGAGMGAKGPDGKVNYVNDLTPGELQIRGKEMRAIDDKLQTSESQLSRFEPMMADISKISDQDWNKQAAAKLAAEKGGGVGELLGERMKNNAVKQLESYLMSTVLDRMSQLGGNDSNEELQRMRADLPSVYNSKEAAVQMLNRIHQWQNSTNEAIKLRRQSYSDGSYFRDPTPRNFYREAYETANPKAAPGGYQAPQGWSIEVE